VGSGFTSAFSNVGLTSDFRRTLVGFSDKSEVYKLFLNSVTAVITTSMVSDFNKNTSAVGVDLHDDSAYLVENGVVGDADLLMSLKSTSKGQSA
jgi:hypothetical protein